MILLETPAELQCPVLNAWAVWGIRCMALSIKVYFVSKFLEIRRKYSFILKLNKGSVLTGKSLKTDKKQTE